MNNSLKISEEAERAELEQKIADMQNVIKKLNSEIQSKDSDYKKEYNAHLDRLHRYNEVKDAGQVLLGQLAIIEGIRTKDLYPRFGLEIDD